MIIHNFHICVGKRFWCKKGYFWPRKRLKRAQFSYINIFATCIEICVVIASFENNPELEVEVA